MSVDLNPQVIARVREAADLLEVAGDHVSLKRHGRRWTGLCPFHQEKTPSFSIDPERGLYYCFGCQAGGDVIRFVMETESLAFPEAVERLARRFSVELPVADPAARRRRGDADRIRALLGEAQQFYAERLRSPAGGAARRELERRGFAADSWEEIGFGFAPDAWRELTDHLKRRHTEKALIEAGLAVTSDRGGSPYDRFRNRVTFPIHGSDGRLVAFGGRALGDTEPKYLNSPEGPLFHKRSTLFMLDRARGAMAEAGHALVVEGYFDCLSLHRVGIRQAVATLGTALTVEHARVLRRLASRVLLCYDADAAGRRAAETGAGVLLAAGIEVGLVVLPPGRDPDDVIRDDGVAAFAELLGRPTSLLDFLLTDLPSDPRERRRAGVEVAPLLGTARDPVLRFGLLEELARRLDLPVEVVRERARRRRGARPPAEPAGAPRPTRALSPGEREILRIVITGDPERRREVLPHVHPELFADGAPRRLLELLQADLANGSGGDPAAALLGSGEDDEMARLVAELSLSELPPLHQDGVRAQLLVLLREQAKRRSRELQEEIRAAEARGDEGEIERLLAEKARIRQEIPQI